MNLADKFAAIVLVGFIFCFGFIFGFNVGREGGREDFINKFYNKEFKIISKTSRVDGQYSYTIALPNEIILDYDFSTSDNLELNSTILLKNE